VIADVEGHVQQFADLLPPRRRLHREKRHRKAFSAANWMGLGAHPADAARDRRISSPAAPRRIARSLATPDLEVRVRDITLFIQKMSDLPCPSRRVMGLIAIVSLVPPLQGATAKAELVDRPGQIGMVATMASALSATWRSLMPLYSPRSRTDPSAASILEP